MKRRPGPKRKRRAFPSTLFSQYAAGKRTRPADGAGEITTALLEHPLVADAVVIKARAWGMISSDTWCQPQSAMTRRETSARLPGPRVR